MQGALWAAGSGSAAALPLQCSSRSSFELHVCHNRRFTNKRVIITNSSPLFSSATQIPYRKIKEVRAAPRALGAWGDMVIFLKVLPLLLLLLSPAYACLRRCTNARHHAPARASRPCRTGSAWSWWAWTSLLTSRPTSTGAAHGCDDRLAGWHVLPVLQWAATVHTHGAHGEKATNELQARNPAARDVSKQPATPSHECKKSLKCMHRQG